MFKLKDNLVKVWGEGIELKMKHDAILSEKEKLLNEYQNLEIENDAINVQLMIMEGERSDSEARISYLESRELGANQQVE